MAHEIWGKRFYSERNRPAWHRVSAFDEYGLDPEQQYNAQDLVKAFEMPYVEKYPVLIPQFDELTGKPKIGADGQMVYTQGRHNVIMRAPDGDQGAQEWAVVHEDYELIDYMTSAQIWDRSTNLKVGTLGALRDGKILFISGKLPSFDVRGDQVDNYLLFNNGVSGDVSASAHVTGVRVVCANTLRAAVANSDRTLRIIHHSGAADRLEKWLKDMVERSYAALETLQEAYEILADKPARELDVKWIAKSIYPVPERPDFNRPSKRDLQDRIATFEYHKQRAENFQAEAVNLFNGKGTGMNTPAANGTLFGALNVFTELETYRRGRGDSVATNLMIGDRGRNIKKAFSLCQKIAAGFEPKVTA